MVDQVERVKVVEPAAGDARQIREVSTARVSGSTVAVRIIWFIAGAILILLAFRFVLALLGANPANAFANFIYTTSYPFVAPFFGLFSYDRQYGVSRFEIYTLVAMAVYAVIAWGLARLFTIGEPRQV